MADLANKDLVTKFMNMPLVKGFLEQDFVVKTNASLQKDIKTIFMVLGWIGIILGAYGLLGALSLLSMVLFAFVSPYALTILISVAGSALNVFIGYGILSYKSYVPLVSIISFILFLVQSVITLAISPFNIFGVAIGLAVSVAILTLILKNINLFISGMNSSSPKSPSSGINL